MTAQTSDVFANTNPAFGATLLHCFVAGHHKAVREGAEFPLLFLAFPMATSSLVSETFEGTNRNTSLLSWVQRHPEVRLALPELTSASIPYTRRAIMFALSYQLIRIESNGLATPWLTSITNSHQRQLYFPINLVC